LAITTGRSGKIKLLRYEKMEYETIRLPKELLRSIKVIVDKTRMFEDETDFINQAIIKEIRKYKEL